MLLIDRVIERIDQGAIVAARLADAEIFSTSDGVHACTGVELLAQAAAAYFGLQAVDGADARPGMLVACREYHCAVSHFPAGGELLIRVQALSPMPDSDRAGLVRFSGEIHDSVSNEPLASGTLSVYL